MADGLSGSIGDLKGAEAWTQTPSTCLNITDMDVDEDPRPVGVVGAVEVDPAHDHEFDNGDEDSDEDEDSEGGDGAKGDSGLSRCLVGRRRYSPGGPCHYSGGVGANRRTEAKRAMIYGSADGGLSVFIRRFRHF